MAVSNAATAFYLRRANHKEDRKTTGLEVRYINFKLIKHKNNCTFQC